MLEARRRIKTARVAQNDKGHITPYKLVFAAEDDPKGSETGSLSQRREPGWADSGSA